MRRLDDLLLRLAAGPAALAAAALVALTLLLCLPGFFGLPPVDRDEASFAQASRQMYETGDLVEIRLHDAPRLNKPAGIYWLQAAAVAATGGRGADDIATYRAVSLLGAVAAVLLTWRIGRTLFGPVPGFFGAVLLAASLVLGAEARLAKTDAVLLATILAAQAVLARLWMAPDRPLPRRAAAAFWAALAAATLVKGPIGPMVVGLTAAALALLERRAGWLAGLRPLWGLALFLALVVPWYAAITLRTGGAFWAASLGRDLMAKVAEGQESHGAPPGSYLVTLWLAFWPSALVLALALPAAWALRRDRAARFCLAWIVPGWIVFELTATKLLHYTLPFFPALALLAAAGWWRTEAPLGALWRRAAALALLAVPFALFLGLALAARSIGAAAPWPFAAAAVALAAASALTWRMIASGLRAAPFAGVAALSLALAAGLYPGLARVAPLWPSDAARRSLAAFDACADPLVVSAGYREPSLVFRTTRAIRFLPGEAAAGAVAAAPCALAFVADAERAAFEAGLARLGAAASVAGRIDGINIGSGRPVALTVFTRAP